MAINKDHPDYPGYIAKCKALADKYYHQEAREEEKAKGWRGLDSPVAGEVYAICTEHHRELKKLQAEYSHLFCGGE